MTELRIVITARTSPDVSPVNDREPVVFRVVMPWWWRLYAGLARFNVSLGLNVDPDKVAETIAARIKIKRVIAGRIRNRFAGQWWRSPL